MKIVTPDTMAEIDSRAQEELHIPGIIPMEEAGRAVFRIAREMYPRLENERNTPIVVVAGPGNNGGDGLVAARAAWLEGYRYLTVIVTKEKIGSSMQVQMKMCKAIGIPVLVWGNEQAFKALDSAQYLFDGISGTGIRGALYGAGKDAVAYLENLKHRENGESPVIVSIDNPSGMYSGGGPGTLCVHSDLTVTMGLPKSILYYPHFRAACGHIACYNPGFPEQILTSASQYAKLVDIEKTGLPDQSPDAYKNRKGHVAVFAGSPEYPGAALLAGRTALYSGAGLVTVISVKEVCRAIIDESPSLMVRDSKGDGTVQAGFIKDTYSAVLAGPGWGRKEGRKAEEQLKEILESGCPVVIDADALGPAAKLIGENPQYVSHNQVILTPHPGEFRTMTGFSSKEEPNRVKEAVCQFAADTGCTVIYKSHIVIIADHTGECSIIDGMNPAMGTAGAGDVLAGLAAALLARGLDASESAVAAASIHQLAGRRLYGKNGNFISTDLIPEIARLCR